MPKLQERSAPPLAAKIAMRFNLKKLRVLNVVPYRSKDGLTGYERIPATIISELIFLSTSHE